MATHGAPRRDFQALERRRQRAAGLFAGGQTTQGAIARLLAASRQSVMRWYQAWRAGGRAGLKAAGRAGRKPRLEAHQLAAVETALRRGPIAAGFTTNLWTLPRVAVVIERVTGVHYHPGHVWRILGRLHWTPQRPAKRAKERNDAAIRHWVDVRWPTVKKTLAAGAPGSSSRTKAGSPNAPRSGAPWAPRGETPVLIHAFNWKKLSVAAALAFRWDGRRSQLFFQTCPGSYNGPRLIAFLNVLKRHAPRRRLVLIWDGLPAHKSAEMRAYLARQRRWLTVERLPGYAPDLNPVDTLWGNIKGQELANLCADDLGDAATALRRGMARVRRHPTLARAFLKHAGLSF